MIDVDCESNRVDKAGPNVLELVMQSLKEQRAQETGVEMSGDGSLQRKDEIWIDVDCEKNRVDKGGQMCVKS